MKLRPLLTLSAALLALSLGLVTAQTTAVPNFISYQGRVVDAAGNNVGKDAPVNRTVIFRIWDNPSSTNTANLIYSESQTVTVSDGEFSVLVGQGVANTTQTFGYSEAGTDKKLADLGTAFNGKDRYLGVTVAATTAIALTDNEITPRQQIVSTAFAMRAKFAENVSGTVSLAKETDFILNPVTLPPGSVASNYGLGWYGSGRLFNGTAMDGPVLYGNSGGALGSNASGTQKTALRWDASGRVGIGAASIESVSNKLTLQGDMATTPGDQLTIRGNTDNNKRLSLGYDTAANKATLQSYFAASSAGLLLLNPSGGNVGVNKVDPSVALDVTGAVKASTSMAANGNNGHVFTGTGDTDGGLFSPADGTVTLKTDNTERVRVTPSGRVGIGNTNPGVALDVTGDIKASGDLTAANVSAGQLSASSRVMTNSIEFWSPGDLGALFKAGAGAFPTNSSAASGEMVLMGSSKLHLATANGGAAVMTLSGSNVGIGTTTPTRAKLEVFGSVSTAVPAVYAHTPTNIASAGAFTRSVSIYSDKVIWANDWIVSSSDERIKTISGISDGVSDLRTLMGVNVTNYSYKDVLGKGNAPQKKLIAQQVEKVFPMAVSQQVDVVPDIYKQATIQDGWVELATNLKKGERVKLITGGDEGSVHEVLEVLESKFRTDFKPVGDKVFVFGREVNDFRTVDYDAIAMLNVSATQQLKREKDAEIQALRDENATLRRELVAKDASVETRLIALERRMAKAGTTETVSLQAAQAAK